MERADTGWTASTPQPRWRTILDRALLGPRTEEAEGDVDYRRPRRTGRRPGGGYGAQLEWQPAQRGATDQLDRACCGGTSAGPG